MYNVGEKIVCIYTGKISYDYGVDIIKEGEIYTVDKDIGDCGIKLKEVDEHYYNQQRFISLSEFRRLKINKIINEKD
jgi:hypothetical protein